METTNEDPTGGHLRPSHSELAHILVCEDMGMRLHISLPDELVAQLDRKVGRRRRSAFLAATLTRALEDERRWRDIEDALGTIEDGAHDWDDDPQAWVRAQRESDSGRLG